jgi:hypothetical protein
MIDCYRIQETLMQALVLTTLALLVLILLGLRGQSLLVAWAISSAVVTLVIYVRNGQLDRYLHDYFVLVTSIAQEKVVYIIPTDHLPLKTSTGEQVHAFWFMDTHFQVSRQLAKRLARCNNSNIRISAVGR